MDLGFYYISLYYLYEERFSIDYSGFRSNYHVET